MRPHAPEVRADEGPDADRPAAASADGEGKGQLVAPGETAVAVEAHIAIAAHRERSGERDLLARVQHIVAPLRIQRARELRANATDFEAARDTRTE